MSHVNRSTTRPETTRRFRLAGYDYRSAGIYFVTFCTYRRHQVLGRIHNGELNLSPAGSMVVEAIEGIESHFPSCELDCSVVMPNHVHILIGLGTNISLDESAKSVSDIVRWLKNSTVRRYGVGVKSKGWPAYDGKLWQEGFHDHIVRSGKDLGSIREYVANNVFMWEKDRFNGSD